MGRVRALHGGILICFVLFASAQQDSTSSNREFYGGVGIHLTQSLFSAPAVDGHVKLKYKVFELALRYGKNKASLNNIRGFDELDVNGDWVEYNLGILVPLVGYTNPRASLKLAVGVGSANSEIEYREIFESLPPFQDLVYREKYSNMRQKFASFSFGYQGYINEHIAVGYGVVGFQLWNQDNTPKLAQITPFKVRSPVGLYAELTFLL